MKTLALSALCLLLSTAAHAAPITATQDPMVDVTLIEGHAAIPTVGDLTGSVVSIYAGSAMAFERYLVTVGNVAAPAEGDDSIVQQTFELPMFHGAVKEAFSRRIDKNTYSIAFFTETSTLGKSGMPIYTKKKVLLQVHFTESGIANVADLQILNAK